MFVARGSMLTSCAGDVGGLLAELQLIIKITAWLPWWWQVVLVLWFGNARQTIHVFRWPPSKLVR
jgi:hypothetical protein